jgi:CHASE3 domain sensor protein
MSRPFPESGAGKAAGLIITALLLFTLAACSKARIRRINANLEQVDEEEQEILDIGKNECAASAYARLQTA